MLLRFGLLVALTLVVFLVAFSRANPSQGQLALEVYKPLRNGGLYIETFQIQFTNRPEQPQQQQLPQLPQPKLPLLQQQQQQQDQLLNLPNETPLWPQDLPVSFCDSLLKPRDKTSCLTEVIRRMEEDMNRKMEILVDADTGAQLQIAGLWVVLLMLSLLATCGMCLKTIRRQHKRASYKRIHKKLNEIHHKSKRIDVNSNNTTTPSSTTTCTTNINDIVIDDNCTNSGAVNRSKITEPTTSLAVTNMSPQVMFQPFSVLPQYYPIPLQE